MLVRVNVTICSHIIRWQTEKSIKNTKSCNWSLSFQRFAIIPFVQLCISSSPPIAINQNQNKRLAMPVHTNAICEHISAAIAEQQQNVIAFDSNEIVNRRVYLDFGLTFQLQFSSMTILHSTIIYTKLCTECELCFQNNCPYDSVTGGSLFSGFRWISPESVVTKRKAIMLKCPHEIDFKNQTKQ